MKFRSYHFNFKLYQINILSNTIPSQRYLINFILGEILNENLCIKGFNIPYKSEPKSLNKIVGENEFYLIDLSLHPIISAQNRTNYCKKIKAQNIVAVFEECFVFVCVGAWLCVYMCEFMFVSIFWVDLCVCVHMQGRVV